MGEFYFSLFTCAPGKPKEKQKRPFFTHPHPKPLPLRERDFIGHRAKTIDILLDSDIIVYIGIEYISNTSFRVAYISNTTLRST